MDTSSPTWVDAFLGGEVNYVALAVPIFFLLIAIEALVGYLGRKDYYRLNDSITDLSCGILQQVTGVFCKTILFVGYVVLYQHFALLDIANASPNGKIVAAIALFLGVDFCYYWFHRTSHELNAPWAAHAVHHQSEDYNLAVALRQSSFQAFFSWVFYLPLAIIGFPPLWFVTMSAFNTLYQFWIHTRAIGKLGPLEWVLNTPSHHRVHHARNPQYLDRNHAGTLIIWDRMFGTFVEEEEECVYGIRRPLASWNPVWANFHEFAELWEDAKAAPRWWDKFRIWFMPTGWRPEGLPPRPPAPEVIPGRTPKYETHSPPSVYLYVLIHFTLVLGMGIFVMKSGAVAWETVAAALLVGLGVLNLGGLFERKSWVMGSEVLRLFATAVFWAAYFATLPSAVMILGLMLASFVALAWIRSDWQGSTADPFTTSDAVKVPQQ